MTSMLMHLSISKIGKKRNRKRNTKNKLSYEFLMFYFTLFFFFVDLTILTKQKKSGRKRKDEGRGKTIVK